MTAQTLRPYQERALHLTREAYRAGKHAVVLVCPTGGGKTTIGARLIVGAERKGNQALWLAHRDELLDQARDRLLAEGVARVGIIAADRPRMNAPVQVASLDTLVSRKAGGLPPAKVVVFDEAHHAAADTYSEIVRHYREQGAAILGLTATPERGDGRPLGAMFDALVPVSTVRELQALRYLVPCTTYRPGAYQRELSMDPVAAYLSRTAGERAFCFCLNVQHAEGLTLAFLAQGVQAASIHADTPRVLRRARLEAFKLQDRKPLLDAGYTEAAPLVLCNAYVLTEGVDAPEASHAILARGCGHAGMMLQMVGRVLRAAPGKVRAVFSDLRGVTHRRSIGIPEADRTWSLDGKPMEQAAHERERPALTCPACSAVVPGWRTDREGWRCCPVCRERISAPEKTEIRPSKQHHAGSTAPADEKAKALARFARTAARMGFKPGFAAAKYRETYGYWPPFGAAQRAFAEAVRDQGHPPPVREPKPAPVEQQVETGCVWCGRGPIDCTCEAG